MDVRNRSVFIILSCRNKCKIDRSEFLRQAKIKLLIGKIDFMIFRIRNADMVRINCVRRNLISYYGNKSMRKKKWGLLCHIMIKSCLQG